MTSINETVNQMLSAVLKREEETIETYSRYSSQAGDPALSTILNEFVQEKTKAVEELRRLAGPETDRDVFEEQVYGHQIGGRNPAGYRKGGTAGTQPLGDQRAGRKPAGGNVGFEAAQLEAGWYEPVQTPLQPGSHVTLPPGSPLTHGNNYGMELNPPAGSIQSTDIARGEIPSGGYLTYAFTQAPGIRGNEGAVQGSSNDYVPWATSDDDAIVRDLVSKEMELDSDYAAIEAEISRRAAHGPAATGFSATLSAIGRIRDAARRRIERLTNQTP